ncbi:MAG: RDD family protein [Dermatophilaceae bacterium]|nr:RDD family protein [Dermatophilaceae bacterium]NUQ32634.1 RDD family protein [Dermatophilaceae bacterium]
MSQQPSGWYDDPSQPDMLRYWDGVSWTNHTAPKKSPTASQSTIGLAQEARGDQSTDRTGAAAPTPTTPMPQGSGWQSQSQTPQQYHQQAPANAQWMYNIRTTADGIPLASWGKRLGAWLIDGIILGICSYLLIRATVPGYVDAIQRVVDAAAAQDQAAMSSLINEAAREAFKAGLVSWLFGAAYCIAFWTTTAQTPGKMALGISVRRADVAGPLDIGTALRRRLLSAIQLVPLISGLYFFVFLLDGLWPLWDDKRQALHDKVAGTQVVEGKQPRKQA